MLTLNRVPDSYTVLCENENTDAHLTFVPNEHGIAVHLTACDSLPKLVKLRWKERVEAPVTILGDAWERGYGDLGWLPLNEARVLPWYFAARMEGITACFGVMVQPNAFVSFACDGSGVTCLMDVSCGGRGVELKGRTLCCATLVHKVYENITPFAALQAYCRALCPENTCLPDHPVYGGNNWYYAYGVSSAQEMLSDARLQSELAGDHPNRPYMVIDDGWQLGVCCGPWLPNRKYGDMADLAARMKALGVRPGIWVRPLHGHDRTLPAEWQLKREGPQPVLDASHPGVLEYVKDTIRTFRAWGYTLIKHDFSTVDILGVWGHEMGKVPQTRTDWTFYDRTRTSAEIVLQFYRAVREAAGDAIVIGCNTVGHLCAGLNELYRAGDDTSGREWERTRFMGINTLAFRLPQDGIFYRVDADCVGILGQNIPWELNRQWLKLLAASGTPLFVSCPNGLLTPEQTADLKAAYALAAEGTSTAQPLDWLYDQTPSRWCINGEDTTFSWHEE